MAARRGLRSQSTQRADELAGYVCDNDLDGVKSVLDRVKSPGCSWMLCRRQLHDAAAAQHCGLFRCPTLQNTAQARPDAA